MGKLLIQRARSLSSNMVRLGLHVVFTLTFMGAVLLCFYVFRRKPFTQESPIQWNSFVDSSSCRSSRHSKGELLKLNLTAPTWNYLEAVHVEVSNGGAWKPVSCRAEHQLAIVIPYHDRDEHLRVFLQHMHPFLQRQLLDYKIYVVEQVSALPFNRGMLFNVGFVEALRDRRWPCFVFHDVDHLPESDENSYSCGKSPRHLSPATDKHDYRMPYHTFFGGVSAFTADHFARLNGCSNYYFGWGQEDDDLWERIKYRGLQLTRGSLAVLRYTVLKHNASTDLSGGYNMMVSAKTRVETDGLSSLKDNYEVSRENLKLYTKLRVDIKQEFFQQARQFRDKLSQTKS